MLGDRQRTSRPDRHVSKGGFVPKGLTFTATMWASALKTVRCDGGLAKAKARLAARRFG